MQRGPKPKSTEQAKRDGTRPSRVPNPPLRTGVEASIEPPESFNRWQTEAWEQLVTLLDALDILDTADSVMVETCAAMVGRMREARHELSVRGADMVEVTQRGAAIPSPYWKIEREAAQQVTRLLAELGLGPSARARLASSGAVSKRPEEALDDLLGEPGRLRAV